MPVTLLAMVTVNEDEPAALAQYLSITGPLLERVGARMVRRFKVNQGVVGALPAMSAILVEYPSAEAVDQVFNSPEYAGVIPFRDRAFSYYNISVVHEEADSSVQVSNDQ